MSNSNPSPPHFSVLFLTTLGLGLLLLTLANPRHVNAGDDLLRKLQRAYNDTIQPILETHCSECHTGSSAAVGFDLEQYEQIDQILAGRKRWKKLQKRVLSKEMPPEDCEPLDPESFQALTQWLDTLFTSADCLEINPGRVTLRRLNRIEYQNTIRDLIGIEYQPAVDFPGDDVGYGFDNIADVISLPPILMEKYLQAAEAITAEAIVDPSRILWSQIIEPKDFAVDDSVQKNEERILFFSNASIEKKINVPATGDYLIKVIAAGDQGGGEPVKMSVGIGRKKPVERKVRAKADEEETVELKLRIPQGEHPIKIGFLNDFYETRDGESPIDRNLHLLRIEIQGPLSVSLPASHQKLIGGKVPEGTAAQLERAKKIMQLFASRAFRRKVRTDELNRLVEFYQDARTEGDSFELALRFPLQAILVSPHFLFKVETPTTPGQIRELNDFELATSLSYFLWSTMPDNELFLVAAKGELKKPDVYRRQVERLLAHPRSSALVDNFVAQWLQLRKLENFEPDPVRFPGVDFQLRQDMIQETKLLITDLIQNNHRVLELLSSKHTFVNQRLAAFYGLDTIRGEHFQRIDTTPLGRSGLLTQASILTVTSNPNRTSPVKRGKWIMENLLGDEPPPADPSAAPIEDQKELVGNLRQRMEQHRADPNCAACHKVMDQLGFALENFDAVGRWRENDEGYPVDATGALPGGKEFTGAIEMQRMILDDMRDDFLRCLTEKMLIYAAGRGTEFYDECAIDKIVATLKQNDYRFRELIYLIATSDPFTKRRG